jgi:hypothetical protein
MPAGGKRPFYSLKTCRPALRPTQPPIQWVPLFFPGGKGVSSRVNVNNEWSYTSTPPLCLHGVKGDASGVDVKNEWSYTSTPFLCIHGVDRDFTFLFYNNKIIY